MHFSSCKNCFGFVCFLNGEVVPGGSSIITWMVRFWASCCVIGLSICLNLSSSACIPLICLSLDWISLSRCWISASLCFTSSMREARLCWSSRREDILEFLALFLFFLLLYAIFSSQDHDLLASCFFHLREFNVDWGPRFCAYLHGCFFPS